MMQPIIMSTTNKLVNPHTRDETFIQVERFLRDAVCGAEVEFPQILVLEQSEISSSRKPVDILTTIKTTLEDRGFPCRSVSRTGAGFWSILGKFSGFESEGVLELSTHETHPAKLPELMQALKAILNLMIFCNDNLLLPFVGSGWYDQTMPETYTLGYHENYSLNGFSLHTLSNEQRNFLAILLITATLFSPIIPQRLNGKICLVSSSKAGKLRGLVSPRDSLHKVHMYLLKNTANETFEVSRRGSLHINVYSPDISPLSQFARITMIGMAVTLATQEEALQLYTNLADEVFQRTSVALYTEDQIQDFFNRLTVSWPAYVLFKQHSPDVDAALIVLSTVLKEFIGLETPHGRVFGASARELVGNLQRSFDYTDAFLTGRIYKTTAEKSGRKIEQYTFNSCCNHPICVIDETLYSGIFADYLNLTLYPFILYLHKWTENPHESPYNADVTKSYLNKYYKHAHELGFDSINMSPEDIPELVTNRALERIRNIHANRAFEEW
ncbi:MAG: hypothetical protein NZO16_02770 [Deltaproteobacteria bacterium]|nr:hypothetical protein [Deltaproteobacteria bacterium]